MKALKDYTVVASGKVRETAYNKLNSMVNFISWQQGGRIPKDELAARLAQADALYSTGNIVIDEKLLAMAPNLKVVAQASVGYDNIDVAACAERGIPVGNTPGVLVDAVADLAYGLILDSARRIVQADAHVKKGLWGQRVPIGLAVDLAGKTLGIVGMGDIGSAVAKRAQVSQMQVVYHNRHQRVDDAELGVTYMPTLDKLLSESDFVLLAVTLNPSTKHMLNEAAFAKMKQGSRFDKY